MNEKEAKKNLKVFIKGLEKLKKEGAGLIDCEMNYGIRDTHPGDPEWRDGQFKQIKHDGYITINLNIFKPDV